MSGDWVPVSLPGRIRNVLKDVKILALGGATEASIWSNCFEVPEHIPEEWRSIPYGKPLANQRYYILDQNMENCPDWVPGNLYIAGTGVAKGYLNDKEKTVEKFVIYPKTGERLYCTGDVGRYWKDGNIEFMGRVDNQIKINGYKNIFGEILSIHKIIYVIGMNKKEWTERFDKELNNYEILVKEIEGHELKEEIQANIEIANKYLFIDSNNVLDILKEAGELLAQGIIINKVFLVNPENATNNDLYLGDMVIINGTQQVIDSWRSAVLGTVKVYNGEIKEICDVVKKEVKNENEK